MNFSQALTLSQFAANLQCNGQSVFVAFYMPGTKTVQVSGNQKPPGSSCVLHVTAPVVQDVAFTVNPAPIPTPLRVVTKWQNPYEYGVLEHPFPFSLGDVTCSVYDCASGTATLKADSLQQVQDDCSAGIGYARIDYAAVQIETVNGLGQANLAAPNFTIEDAIMGQLASCGMTELPSILQYDAGAINAGGKGQSAMMVDPNFYGKFVGDVVAHLKAKYPQVTMIQLGNEPNDHGWGTCPTGPSTNPWLTSDESGLCFSAYLKAGYAAAKAANPAIIVVAPALSDGGTHTDFRKFVPVLLQNGCGTGTCWDVIDIHNYAWFNPTFSPGQENEWDDYKTLESLVPNTPVMLTEAGWCQSDVNFSNQYCMSEAAAAQYYAIASNLILADPNVIGVTWVNLYDYPQSGYSTNFWAETSFEHSDHTPKQGYAVLCAFTGCNLPSPTPSPSPTPTPSPTPSPTPTPTPTPSPVSFASVQSTTTGLFAPDTLDSGITATSDNAAIAAPVVSSAPGGFTVTITAIGSGACTVLISNGVRAVPITILIQ